MKKRYWKFDNKIRKDRVNDGKGLIEKCRDNVEYTLLTLEVWKKFLRDLSRVKNRTL